MSDDLADRISDGHVAVLELVPGEQRFIELSRFVLRGGASRFAAVVLDDEPVRYVLPIGVPGASKLDFGVLLIQRTRCAQVWRTDPAKPYHAIVCDLGPETTVAQSPVNVRGEVWGRFDLRHPGAHPMTFLVPPVTSPALPRMLHRVLVDEPQSKQGPVHTTPLATEITEGIPMVAPSAAVMEPINPANEHTVIMPAVPAADAAKPADAPRPGAESSKPVAETARWGSTEDAASDSAAVASARTEPAPSPTGDPDAVWSAAAASGSGSSVAAPSAERDRKFARPEQTAPAASEPAQPLYRDSARTAPGNAKPVAIPMSTLSAETTGSLMAIRDTTVTAPKRRLPDAWVNFLTALMITLVIGGLVLFARYQGWLPF